MLTKQKQADRSGPSCRYGPASGISSRVGLTDPSCRRRPASIACTAAECFLRGLGALLLSCWLPVAAAGDLIENYFSGLESFEADFTQTVVDANGETLQDSKGRVWIQRPGRFRWDYETPYHQQIVADGKQLWTWDEDLEQATVRKVDEALSSTPAMLLSGYRPLDEVMNWTEVLSEAGMTWYRLEPKQADSSVEEVRIGFDGKALSLIQVLDGFGNRTTIRFTNGRRNVAIDPDRFRFEVPPGTDVIGTPE